MKRKIFLKVFLPIFFITSLIFSTKYVLAIENPILEVNPKKVKPCEDPSKGAELKCEAVTITLRGLPSGVKATIAWDNANNSSLHHDTYIADVPDGDDKLSITRYFKYEEVVMIRGGYGAGESYAEPQYLTVVSKTPTVTLSKIQVAACKESDKSKCDKVDISVTGCEGYNQIRVYWNKEGEPKTHFKENIFKNIANGSVSFGQTFEYEEKVAIRANCGDSDVPSEQNVILTVGNPATPTPLAGACTADAGGAKQHDRPLKVVVTSSKDVDNNTQYQVKINGLKMQMHYRDPDGIPRSTALNFKFSGKTLMIDDIRTDVDIAPKIGSNDIEIVKNDKPYCKATFTVGEGGTNNISPTVVPSTDPPCAGTIGKNGCENADTAIGDFATDPEGFVRRIFTFILSISGGIAILVIISAGYKYMTSQGNPEAVKGAQEMLVSAVTGLLFLIFSFVLLNFIGIDILRIPGF